MLRLLYMHLMLLNPNEPIYNSEMYFIYLYYLTIVQPVIKLYFYSLLWSQMSGLVTLMEPISGFVPNRICGTFHGNL